MITYQTYFKLYYTTLCGLGKLPWGVSLSLEYSKNTWNARSLGEVVDTDVCPQPRCHDMSCQTTSRSAYKSVLCLRCWQPNNDLITIEYSKEHAHVSVQDMKMRYCPIFSCQMSENMLLLVLCFNNGQPTRLTFLTKRRSHWFHLLLWRQECTLLRPFLSLLVFRRATITTKCMACLKISTRTEGVEGTPFVHLYLANTRNWLTLLRQSCKVKT